MPIDVEAGRYTGRELIRFSIQALEQQFGINGATPYTLELIRIYQDLSVQEKADTDHLLRTLEGRGIEPC